MIPSNSGFRRLHSQMNKPEHLGPFQLNPGIQKRRKMLAMEFVLNMMIKNFSDTTYFNKIFFLLNSAKQMIYQALICL